MQILTSNKHRAQLAEHESALEMMQCRPVTSFAVRGAGSAELPEGIPLFGAHQHPGSAARILSRFSFHGVPCDHHCIGAMGTMAYTLKDVTAELVASRVCMEKYADPPRERTDLGPRGTVWMEQTGGCPFQLQLA